MNRGPVEYGLMGNMNQSITDNSEKPQQIQQNSRMFMEYNVYSYTNIVIMLYQAPLWRTRAPSATCFQRYNLISSTQPACMMGPGAIRVCQKAVNVSIIHWTQACARGS